MAALTFLPLHTSIYSFHNSPIHRARCYLFPKSQLPINFFYLRCTKADTFNQNLSKKGMWGCRDKGCLLGFKGKDGIFGGEKLMRREKRNVIVRFNEGFGFNGGGDGGGSGRKIDGNTARVLGNLALAVGLTYLSMTGQLGWVLDTIVSLWLLALILPVVGIGAFLWWAGRDMMQGPCPNCGNAFQVFKSSLNDEPQLCPFCSQPFSVEGNEFVKEPIKFSKGSTSFGQAFDDFTPWTRKGKDNSTAVVDVEAEIKDVE